MTPAFSAAIASSDPSCSRCTGPTFVMSPTSGSAIATSSAICPAPRIAISSTRTSVPSGAPRIVSGSPISVLRFCGGRRHPPAGATIAASRSFVEVLPVEPVTPMTLAPSSCRQATASACSAASGSSASRTRSPERLLPGATRTPHAPACSAAAAKAPPSTCSPRSPTKRSPGRTSRESIVTRSGRARRRAPVQRAPAACGDAARRPRAHAVPPWRPRRRRTGPSGRPRAPGPARGPCRRRGARPRRGRATTASSIAARRSGSTRTSSRPTPATISATIASGSSRAGVVGGDDDLVGQAPGDLAHDRALAAVAVPARTEDDDDAPAREARAPREDRLERAGLVGVVDEHREPLALLDGLQPARDRRGRAQRARR